MVQRNVYLSTQAINIRDVAYILLFPAKHPDGTFHWPSDMLLAESIMIRREMILSVDLKSCVYIQRRAQAFF
jgi:hypothetical protein